MKIPHKNRLVFRRFPITNPAIKHDNIYRTKIPPSIISSERDKSNRQRAKIITPTQVMLNPTNMEMGISIMEVFLFFSFISANTQLIPFYIPLFINTYERISKNEPV